MSRIVLLATLLLTSLLPITSHATESSIFVTSSVGYPIELRTGAALPPGIAHGLAVVVPLKDGWGYLSEVGMTTGFTALRPSLLLITGPSKKLAPNFILGASAFYKPTPPYDGATSPTHVIGGSIVPIIPISIGSLSFPTAIGLNLATGEPVLAFNLKLAIKVK